MSTTIIESNQVNSTQISHIGYSDGVLKVRFHGGATYLYLHVNKFTYESLINAPSIGSFFHRYIKNDDSIQCIKL